jgi:conjugative transfer signal peptidase TraF
MTGRSETLATMFGGTAILIWTLMAEPIPVCIWNASDSVARGLYRVRPDDERYYGELVVVRPPEPLATFLDLNHFLPIGLPMLKRVAALRGQTVCRRGVAISVDGIEIGEARERDSLGRPLPIWQGCEIVQVGELFLMNWQSGASLDGRYFGPIAASAVIGRAVPVWTWED